jgi:hypothetical protein
VRRQWSRPAERNEEATTPTAPERDALPRAFSQALAARDIDALYRTVAPDFLWSYITTTVFR